MPGNIINNNYSENREREEHLVSIRTIEGKRCEGNSVERIIMLYRLTKLLSVGRVTDALEATTGRAVWRQQPEVASCDFFFFFEFRRSSDVGREKRGWSV